MFWTDLLKSPFPKGQKPPFEKPFQVSDEALDSHLDSPACGSGVHWSMLCVGVWFGAAGIFKSMLHPAVLLALQVTDPVTDAALAACVCCVPCR